MLASTNIRSRTFILAPFFYTHFQKENPQNIFCQPEIKQGQTRSELKPFSDHFSPNLTSSKRVCDDEPLYPVPHYRFTVTFTSIPLSLVKTNVKSKTVCSSIAVNSTWISDVTNERIIIMPYKSMKQLKIESFVLHWTCFMINVYMWCT